MRFRDTLLARILGGFLLNLLVVGIVLWAMYQFRMGPASALTGLSEDRVRNAAAALSDQLIRTPRTQWPQSLDRHNKRHGVQFHLRNARGGPLLEDASELPEPVHQHFMSEFPPLANSPVRRHLARQLQALDLTTDQLDAMERIWLSSLRRFQQSGDPQAAMADYLQQAEAVLPESQRAQLAALTPQHLTPLIRSDAPAPEDWLRRFDANSDETLNAAELTALLEQYSPPTRAKSHPLPEIKPDVITFDFDTSQSRHIWAALEIPVRVRQVSPEFSAWEVADLRPVPGGDRFNALLLLETDPVMSRGFFAEPWPWLTIFLLILGMSALFWLPLVRRITRPLAEVTALTEEIAEGKFQNQVNLNQPDEIGRLAQAVDQMAHRLQGLVGGQRRFLGDVSHELCAPIARLQMALGVFSQNATPEQQPLLDDLREEVEQMAGLVDELLCFTRTGEPAVVELQAVPLQPLVQELLKREAPKLDATVTIPGDLAARAAPDRLERALGNLFRNAQQHAATGRKLEICATVDQEDQSIELTITDAGPGVPADSLDRLFDPFYRPEDARTRETGGTGLGLAIAKTAIEACDGSLHARLPATGGLEFVVRLTST